MIYPADFEQRIGFDQIRDAVAALCNTEAARDRVRQMPFMTDFAQVEQALGETFEMRTILMTEPDYPGGGYTDINSFLRRVRIEGTHLDTGEIVALRKALGMLEALTAFFRQKREAGNDPYPLLSALADPILGFTPVLREIGRILDEFGRIKDNASPELGNIRREIAQKSGQIDKRLQSILRQARASGLVEEDAEISIRDGRAVIPVAAGNKRKLKGLVHDESATGRTAYIEPMEVVELNNEVRELESAEKREVLRILTAFTDQFLRPVLPDLLAAGDYMTGMDFIQAKGRHALAVDATRPRLSPDPVIELHKARHPLLEAALKREGKPIVPLDLTLTREKYILLISGPNAGGKSVCLKTVGLLQYMLQCGLLVPVRDDSETGLFESLFIDIGDQQSLDNDLSTYSSHLQNMKTILRSAGERSLVLIDEFGSGTEPGMGGAIAESVLEKLVERHVWGVITTHYANLKYYAANTSGILNGAMAFDVRNIQPLFRLEMGRPGSSFAFEIARKIGLPEQIIHAAEQKIGTAQAQAEKHIREAARDKRYWESKRERIRQAEKAIDRTAQEYENQLAKVKEERAKILQQARDEAARLVAEANRRIESTIREIREAQAEKERTRSVRSSFEEFREQLDVQEEMDDAISRKMRQLREREARRQEKKARREGEPETSAQQAPEKETPQEIAPGALVRIKGQTTPGEVVSVEGKRVTVAFNSLTTSVEKSRLELLTSSEARKLQKSAPASFTSTASAAAYDTSKKRLNFKRQIDLRGMRAADALAEVENYIDEAIVLGIPQVSILHGKGTGALKEEIRRYLRTVPLVAEARDEHEQFGGAGITVVELDV